MNAYSSNAMFSYHIHDVTPSSASRDDEKLTSPSSLANAFAVPFGRRNYSSREGILSGPIHQGRHDIICALRSLGTHKFSENVEYDVYWLGKEGGVLIICHGEVEDSSGTLNVEQNWVLRKKEMMFDDRYVSTC